MFDLENWLTEPGEGKTGFSWRSVLAESSYQSNYFFGPSCENTMGHSKLLKLVSANEEGTNRRCSSILTTGGIPNNSSKTVLNFRLFPNFRVGKSAAETPTGRGSPTGVAAKTIIAKHHSAEPFDHHAFLKLWSKKAETLPGYSTYLKKYIHHIESGRKDLGRGRMGSAEAGGGLHGQRMPCQDAASSLIIPGGGTACRGSGGVDRGETHPQSHLCGHHLSHPSKTKTRTK